LTASVAAAWVVVVSESRDEEKEEDEENEDDTEEDTEEDTDEEDEDEDEEDDEDKDEEEDEDDTDEDDLVTACESAGNSDDRNTSRAPLTSQASYCCRALARTCLSPSPSLGCATPSPPMMYAERTAAINSIAASVSTKC
jgi:hypothetical protein